MSTLLEIYQQLCTEDLIPEKRQKDIMTAVRYLAAASGSAPDRLDLTHELESTYNARLRDYLIAQGKGHSTIRTSIQGIGQLLRAYHHLPAKMLIPQVTHRSQKTMDAMKAMNKDSPYSHYAWLHNDTYYLSEEDWPAFVTDAFKQFRQVKKAANVRDSTMTRHVKAIEAYLGYLQMPGESRLAHLHPDTCQKLQLPAYKDDLDTILAPAAVSSLPDLFRLPNLQGFIAWNAWRVHTPADARVRERPPSIPSAKGKMVGESVLRMAQALSRKRDIPTLKTYMKHLSAPVPMHNKQAECHQFTHEEIEQVALALMDEARKMQVYTWSKDQYPGSWAALRFATGLVLMLGWRIPLRVRNWTEALIGQNLVQERGVWRWKFEGAELKIGTRGQRTNKLDLKIPAQVVPYLEEYLNVWRPKLPRAAEDRHVLLVCREPGGMMGRTNFTQLLKVHVYRFTGKRMFPHLLRTLFMSNAIVTGMDVATAAYYMNDTIETAMRYYAEFVPPKHEEAHEEFMRRSLSGTRNGHTNGKAS